VVAEAGEVSLRIETAREVLFFGEVGRMGVYGPGTSDGFEEEEEGDDMRLAITPPIAPPMPPRSSTTATAVMSQKVRFRRPYIVGDFCDCSAGISG
jgi:hypothetical protein